MSSGGHFFDNPLGAKSLLERIAGSRERSEQEAYLAKTNAILANLLAKFNARDVEKTREILERILAVIEADLEGSVRLVFGGSVAKRTYVEGLSDVDALVMLESCELSEQPPKEAQQYLARKVAEKVPGAAVNVGSLAVTVETEGMEIQLVPAIRCKGSVKIANQDGSDWSKIDPERFANALTKVNSACGMKVVPVVKLAKAIVAGFAERQKITGYHAEAIAVEVFNGYRGPVDLKSMLEHFFVEGTKVLQRPIRDSSGQSKHVDDYLGSEGSLERRVVADAFARAARRMRLADLSARSEAWLELIQDPQ